MSLNNARNQNTNKKIKMRNRFFFFLIQPVLFEVLTERPTRNVKGLSGYTSPVSVKMELFNEERNFSFLIHKSAVLLFHGEKKLPNI